MVIINTNVLELGMRINQLNTLKSRCEGVDVTTVEIQGSGVTNQQIQQLDQKYAELKTSMVTLLGNSIDFFTNVKESMEQADREAASKVIKPGAILDAIGGGFR